MAHCEIRLRVPVKLRQTGPTPCRRLVNANLSLNFLLPASFRVSDLLSFTFAAILPVWRYSPSTSYGQELFDKMQKGVTERGAEGKGKRAGEMETGNLHGLALYCIRNKVSSNRTRERKRERRSSFTRERGKIWPSHDQGLQPVTTTPQ